MATKTRSTIFRVTGIPDAFEASTLESVINDNVQDEERQATIFTASLLPSCYGNGRSHIGLVEFQNKVPHFLQEVATNHYGEYSVTIDGADVTFDQHFFGFAQLYSTPQEADVTAE